MKIWVGMPFITIVMLYCLVANSASKVQTGDGHFKIEYFNERLTNYSDVNPYELQSKFDLNFYIQEENLKIIDSAKLSITPHWGRYFGNNEKTSIQTSGENHDNFGMQELLLHLKKGNFALSGGRKKVKYQEGIFWGDNELDLLPTSYDLLLFQYNFLDLFMVIDQANNNSYNREVTRRTLGFYLKDLSFLYNNWDIFGYHFEDKSKETKFFLPPKRTERYINLGIREHFEWKNLSLINHALFYMHPINHATKKDDLDYMLDFKFYYKFESNFKFMMNIFYTSELYKNIYEDHYNFGGLSFVLNRNNLKGYGTNLTYDLNDQFNFKLSYYRYYRTKETSTIYNNNGTPFEFPIATPKKLVGDDVGLEGNINFSKDLTAGLIYSVFIPQDYIKTVFEDKNVISLRAVISLKF